MSFGGLCCGMVAVYNLWNSYAKAPRPALEWQPWGKEWGEAGWPGPDWTAGVCPMTITF